MITFQSRNEMVRNADMIARKAHSQYPHISVSRIDTMLGKDKVKHFFWDNMAFKYSLKCASERLKVEMDEKNLYKLTVESLKNGIGNCGEEANLAELIGKINGLKNIYSGKIYAGKKFPIHETAFITDKEIKPSKRYSLKAKDAIIVDPWLGITEYAGEYFRRLKTQFKGTFNLRSNSNLKIEADFTSKLTPYKIKKLKEEYPELVIKTKNKIG